MVIMILSHDDEYYMPLVETKDFIALIENKPFFDQAVKKKQEAYEKLVKMSGDNDSTTGNLLDYLYYHKHYKPIGIDLSRQKNKVFLKKHNFTGKLEKTMLRHVFYC